MESKVDLFRAKATRCEERAKNEGHKSAREWQLTLARVYQVLATEAENAATLTENCPIAYWDRWLVP
jgi:hypothetical protein